MLQPPINSLKFVGDTLSVTWPLTFRPRTWSTLHIWWATFYKFCYFWYILLLTYGPTPVRRTTWPYNLDLDKRYDLGGHSACRWCGSSYSICVPSLKFVGLPFRKIWHTSGLSVCRPGDLGLWSMTLKLERIISRGVDNLSTNFGVSRTFRSRLIGQYLSNASCDLAILTFDLEGQGTCCWCGSSCSVCAPSLKFVRLPFRKIWHTSGLGINRPGDLDLWPFDL